MIIVFLGPDGCGKSSTISELRQNLPQGIEKILTYHLAPGLLVRSNKHDDPVSNPHGKPVRNAPLSLLKLLLFLVEYTLGIWIKIRPVNTLKTLIVFDRYYYDILVDPKRYRYGAPIELAYLVSKLIPKPDFLFLLDAPTHILQSRVQEVTSIETTRQKKAYLEFVSSQSNGIVLDATQPLTTIASDVRSIVQKKLKKNNRKCKRQ